MFQAVAWLFAGTLAIAQSADPGSEWRGWFQQGVRLRERADFAGSAAALQKAVALARQFGPGDERQAVSLKVLASAWEELGRYADAERAWLDYIALVERERGPDHPDCTSGRLQIAGLRCVVGDFRTAEAIQRRAVAVLAQSPDRMRELALAQGGLGETLVRLGKFTEARRLLEQARASLERLLGPGNERAAALVNSLGVLAFQEKRPRDAADLFHQALAALEVKLGPDDPKLVPVLSNYARACSMSSQRQEAAPAFDRALSIARQRLGKEHPLYADAASKYADWLRRCGRKAEAKTLEAEARAAAAAASLHARNGLTLDARTAGLPR